MFERQLPCVRSSVRRPFMHCVFVQLLNAMKGDTIELIGRFTFRTIEYVLSETRLVE